LNKEEDPKILKWKGRLASAPEEVVKRTLEATTQVYEDNIEAENRDMPRMTRQKRDHLVHVKHLEGRTDTDTFFSSIRSTRGFRCVQLFIHLATQFLFVALLRREKDNHGGYQDFIREVGAPETLLSDNAKSQTGERWKQTSRRNMTNQITSAPMKQNQNHAERKIGDVKRRTVLTLHFASAPITFWCYAIQFVVMCLNVTARRRLNWRTPHERLYGTTPDISRFRFQFWQKAWYYEPSSKFPESPWRPCRVLFPAPKSGDEFTYKVWTITDLKLETWEDGRELTRDVVIPRKDSEESPPAMPLPLSAYDELQFEPASTRMRKSTKQSRTKAVRKRKQELASERTTRPQRKKKPKPNDTTTTTWTARVSDNITLATADLTEDEDDFDISDPTQHLIQHPMQSLNTPTKVVPSLRDRGGDSDIEEFEFEDEPIEMATEVYDELGSDRPNWNQSRGAYLQSLTGHRWKDATLQVKAVWDTGEHSWETFADMKEDHPRMLAEYIVNNEVTRTKRDPRLTWARKTVRDVRRTIKRIRRLYDFFIDDNDQVYRKKKVRGAKKKKRLDRKKPVVKYGVEVPRSVKHARELDAINNDTKWQEAIDLEINSLIDLECFEFKGNNFQPGDGYQMTRLNLIFDVKHDGRRKARLVALGNLMSVPTDVQIYASQVKPMSVRLIDVIADKMELSQLCGDVSNAYVNSYTSEKCYVIAGPEFGEREGECIIIVKALYGLNASGADWHRHFATSLRNFGFQPTRYDRDVWIRLAKDKSHYEYLCTHVDDFKITAKDPQAIMEEIKKEYHIKDEGPPDYYLGLDYKQHNGRWAVGCKKYIKEAVRRIEARMNLSRADGEKNWRLKKYATPLGPDDHPEEDTSVMLDDNGHREYQMLIGMLNWIVGIGRFDIAHSVTSLSRFASCPRKGHLDRALRVFGYLKKKPNRRILVDSRDPIITGGDFSIGESIIKNLIDDYPDAAEAIDEKLPMPLCDEIALTAFVDSDHAHDKVTRRSITGIIILLGRTPVFYFSKRQGAVETSTYSAEFMAMKTAVEEIMALRYMLRGLGVRVETATHLYGDNLGVIQNCTMKESQLKKKHVALSYHRVREAAAASIILPIKIHTKDNFADALTKSLASADFNRLIGALFYG
jgi:hypothetical protein